MASVHTATQRQRVGRLGSSALGVPEMHPMEQPAQDQRATKPLAHHNVAQRPRTLTRGRSRTFTKPRLGQKQANDELDRPCPGLACDGWDAGARIDASTDPWRARTQLPHLRSSQGGHCIARDGHEAWCPYCTFDVLLNRPPSSPFAGTTATAACSFESNDRHAFGSWTRSTPCIDDVDRAPVAPCVLK